MGLPWNMPLQIAKDFRRLRFLLPSFGMPME
jgi:hypothetical protein